LTLQAVSPFDAAVVASVGGLWDTAQQSVADQARLHYRESLPPPPSLLETLFHEGLAFVVRGNVPPPAPTLPSEVVLNSPRLYQRFVAKQAVRGLVGP